MEKDENMDLGYAQAATSIFLCIRYYFVWCKEHCYFEGANTKKGLC